MNISTVVRAAIATCALAISAHASAAVLQVNSSGILTGATGVTVEGKLYNVTFVDGTCESLFSGCDAPSDFAFQSLASAQSAAEALLEEVFIDSPKGSFNSVPSNTSGCTSISSCLTFIPYRTVANVFHGSYAVNHSKNYGAGDAVSNSTLGMTYDLSTVDFYNFAKFEIAAAEVPEPNSLALIGLAFAGLAFLRRRKS